MSYSNDTIQQLEALFNYATIGIVVTNEKGHIINFNKYAEEQFGYSKNDVLGQYVELLIPHQFHTAHKAQRTQFYGQPHPRKMGEGRDLHALKKNGKQFPVEVSLTYYKIEDKVHVIAFIIDITVRKNNEAVVLEQKDALEKVTREIKQLNTALEQKVEGRTQMLRETLTALEQSKAEVNEALKAEKELGELKTRFVTMASHEFRTPLSTILSSAYLLEQYNEVEEPVKRQKHISRIKTAVSDMRGILEDFLSLGKLEEGLVQTNIARFKAIEIFAIIKEWGTEISPTFKAGQELKYTFSGSADVLADNHLLKNILVNLLSNASKFSSENNAILIEATAGENSFLLSVKDNGIGIGNEDKPYLTTRFFRAKNALNIQGTGLGLHIVVKYLELLGGKLTVESELNNGTRFIIETPYT